MLEMDWTEDVLAEVSEPGGIHVDNFLRLRKERDILRKALELMIPRGLFTVESNKQGIIAMVITEAKRQLEEQK